MRILILLTSLIIGVISAIAVYYTGCKIGPGQLIVIPVAPSLQRLQDIGELRVMRAEVATRQTVDRQGERKGPLGVFGRDHRHFEAVVPVQIELGVSLKDLVYAKGENGTHVVQLPRIRIVRDTANFRKEHFVIWKDEGQGFEDEDLVKEATQQGVRDAEGKANTLEMNLLAQQQADDVVRHIAASLLLVSPDKVKIEHPERVEAKPSQP